MSPKPAKGKQQNQLKELQLENSRLKLAVENAISGLCIVDNKGVITFNNQEWARSHGTSAQELLNTPLHDLSLNSIEHQEWWKKQLTLLKKKKKVKAICQHQTVDKKIVYLSLLLDKLDDDQSGSILIASHDITQLKQAHNKAEEREARYKVVLQGMSEGLVVFNTQAKVVDANQKAFEILEMEKEELFNEEPWYKKINGYVANGKLLEAEDYPYQKSLQFNKPVKNVEVKRFSKDGSHKWILISSDPLLTEKGKKLGVVSTFRDITELKQSQEKTNQALAAAKSKAEDLEKLNKIMVDRELKMIELKEEIKRLKTHQK